MNEATILDFTRGAVPGILHLRGWAILSAEIEQPARWSEKLRQKVNDARTMHLRRNLTRFGIVHYDAVGMYGGQSERSSLVLGVSLMDALELGRFYRQATVLVREGLVDCASGHRDPAVDVIELPSWSAEDHTHVFVTGATFRVRLASQVPNRKVA